MTCILEGDIKLELKFPARIEIIANVFFSKPVPLTQRNYGFPLTGSLSNIKTKFSNIELSIKVLETLCLARLNIWTCSKYQGLVWSTHDHRENNKPFFRVSSLHIKLSIFPLESYKALRDARKISIMHCIASPIGNGKHAPTEVKSNDLRESHFLPFLPWLKSFYVKMLRSGNVTLVLQ